MFDFIQRADWAILHGIQDIFRCDFLDFIMPFITVLGNKGAIWILSAIFLIISPKYRKYGFVMLGALTACIIVCNISLKDIVARPRPCWLESVSLLINNPKDYSFPSGHTMSSVTGAAVLTSANHKFGYFAIPLALLIAFSRLYLYVHFPSDVITSVIIGVFIAFTAVRCSENRYSGKAVQK